MAEYTYIATADDQNWLRDWEEPGAAIANPKSARANASSTVVASSGAAGVVATAAAAARRHQAAARGVGHNRSSAAALLYPEGWENHPVRWVSRTDAEEYCECIRTLHTYETTRHRKLCCPMRA